MDPMRITRNIISCGMNSSNILAPMPEGSSRSSKTFKRLIGPELVKSFWVEEKTFQQGRCCNREGMPQVAFFQGQDMKNVHSYMGHAEKK